MLMWESSIDEGRSDVGRLEVGCRRLPIDVPLSSVRFNRCGESQSPVLLSVMLYL